jgi:hypothetical protein
VANQLALNLGPVSPSTAPVLCSVPLLTEAPGANLEPANTTVHLLIIDLPQAPSASREALAFPRDEQLAWLSRAAARGTSLVALLTDHSIELYSTESDRTQAFRPVLESLATRMKSMPVLGKARTVTKSGATAARHLLRRAGGLGSELLGDPRFVTQLHAATALSTFKNALGSTLGSLFRAAASVGRRVRQETALGDPNATLALREVDQLSAERIVEEELASWQTQEAEITRVVEQAEVYDAVAEANLDATGTSMPEIEQSGIRRVLKGEIVFGDEPGSMVRTRVARALASSDE